MILFAAPCLYAQEAQNAPASEVATVNALFEYPVAPESLEGIEAKSIYLVEHFWDALDTKSKKAVDQSALSHAFSVYATPMRWAPKEAVEKSVDALLSRLEKNPVLLLQMTKAAEENLYGPRSEVWIDGVYVKFLEGMLKNKKIKDIHKARYRSQLIRLSNSMTGSTAPEFDFIKPDGSKGHYMPTGNYTLIEFGDPDCYECNMSRLRLESNAAITDLVRNGKLNICFFIPAPEDNWQQKLTEYPEKWVTGAAEGIDDIIDLRTTPSFYLIGPDGRILQKNISLETAIREITDNVK